MRPQADSAPLTSVAGVGGLCGLRSKQTLVTGKQGTEESGWRVRHQPPHPHQLTQFPRTVGLQPSTGTGGNPRLLSAALPALPAATCKNGTVLQPPQQTSVLSIRKRPLPLSGVQVDRRREQGWGPGHGHCPLQNLCPARPAAAHFLLQGLPACCLFQGAFPDSTSPGTPSCILDLLSWQSQVLFRGPSRCWQPPLLPAPLCESKMSRRCTGKP